ncbi:rod shape-determining protein RodA [Rubellimicrobium sp. CFH 75288]|uniref:rod shape-determining protein RodA n=1 Tax=Rubellimicrobium sp. CFH 75288 TaxID=2697034 RepID=UPI0014135FC5|nr:rod shape-determining protein RodA [Rubellimicrobium sp. CFH 75288]NAZ37086.1 rod shape-determining protein RodA [Rubellimicrobium sp. CFH 75288]
MSFLEYQVRFVPTGWRKLLYVNWALVALVTAASLLGILMLYSLAGGRMEPWAGDQLGRFVLGFVVMIAVAMVPITVWRRLAWPIYLLSIGLLVLVDIMGHVGMGAQRWLVLGPIRIQPSEVAKIGLVLALAAYYDWLPTRKVSNPLWMLPPLVMVVLPVVLVLMQPNLGTAVLILGAGGILMFCAGVHWAYFATLLAGIAGAVWAVFESRGKPWQLLHDYQFRRIDTFFDPSQDPLGAGYNITQAKIALGSGGLTGKGFMQGTQSRLNFLPEKHTDFILNTLAEEFGFVGSFALLVIYGLILAFLFHTAVTCRDRFSSLLVTGVGVTVFLLFAVNMLMVMGLAPVVGVPLPLVSYGGSSLLVLLGAFGLAQSAHVHRPR